MGLPVRGMLSNTMKNFVRLVQFAWRYKVRFGLSIGCAAMVALLSFTELGAVYPLLHILFDSQNPQRWISEKIAGLETEILIAQRSRVEARARPRRLRSGEPRDYEAAQRTLFKRSTRILSTRKQRASQATRAGSASPTSRRTPFRPVRNEVGRARKLSPRTRAWRRLD